MRLSKRKRATTASMDITPMIDITFLLLIFFITVTQVSDAAKEEIDLPEQKGQEDEKLADLTINIDDAGKIVVLGETVSLGKVQSDIGKLLVEVGDDPSKLKILVRASRTGDSATVNQLVEMLSGMGLKNVRYATITAEY